ncbi:MAG: 16S rRNA (cytosine(1402)-N(4))-methyltransferase RsmH [Alphaproteobacteria bacterium]|nr:16S rRNA (cytosine(1402)-N(4))-methyltransferase RsmH [Alphaproteobacteria bacterium]
MVPEYRQEHFPVMLPQVLEYLAPKDGETYVDGTFGLGGYSRAILEAAQCRVIAIDRDVNAEPYAKELFEEYGDRFKLVSGCFGDVKELLAQESVRFVDGFVLDIGVSSVQIDDAKRGFSFRFDGPLDMRMGQSGRSAADLVNETDEKELADIIYLYGEERHSRRVAKEIVRRRVEEPFTTTLDLADVVRSVVSRFGKEKIDPATRTFQALRIAVNDELGELERALAASVDILKPGGRLVVVTFHSLEDRIVKRFMREKGGQVSSVSRHMPVENSPDAPRVFEILTRKAVFPDEKEVRVNDRSRSAKLRAAMRTDYKEENSHGY